jgi:ribosomal protein S18 acetylase RimI-like enzyme
MRPDGWRTEPAELFAFHLGQPYFHPIVADVDGAIAGCAEALVQGNAGWLGSIIVRPEYRGRGLGLALTRRLVDIIRSQGCESQVLIATPMGRPVYEKLGFTVESEYIFLKNDSPRPVSSSENLRSLESDDVDALLALDRSSTGESRGPFLRRHLDGGLIHTDSRDQIDGFFLPALGEGLIVAEEESAGLALLQHKLSLGAAQVVVPDANATALRFLQGHGFNETFRAPRMTLDRRVDWQPEKIFSRAGGFCG